MHWFVLALSATALFSISNHIDKYLLSRFFKHKSGGVLVIFSSLIGLAVLPIIVIMHPHVFAIHPLQATIMIFNGILFIVALIPYFYALQKAETSIVVPLYQTIPLFGFALAYMALRETLTLQQVAASLLIIAGAVGITLEWQGKRPRIQQHTLWLMLLSSFLIALNFLIFKFVAVQSNFWVTSFWEYVGFSALGISLLLIVPSYRAQFAELFRHNKLSIIALNTLNEVITIVAKIMVNIATLLAPLALVSAVNGVQPLFVLLLGIATTIFAPHLGRENIQRRFLTQKIISIVIIVAGAVWLRFISP